jgi:hypothetical protein
MSLVLPRFLQGWVGLIKVIHQGCDHPARHYLSESVIQCARENMDPKDMRGGCCPSLFVQQILCSRLYDTLSCFY